MEKLKNINIKKVIKVLTLLFGFVLIIFISFFNASFDFANFNWAEWLANSSILVGIMIFGILMGTSTGADIQKEKPNGLFQSRCADYMATTLLIENIKIYFSQFWLWFKERKLIEKKVSYLIDNQFTSKEAKKCIAHIEKEDLVVGKLGLDESNPLEKIYVKNGVKIRKVNESGLECLKKTLEMKLDTYADSYYLSLYDDGDGKVNEAELGKRINEKIARDKRTNLVIKITSSLVISILWSAITIKDFTEGGGDGAKQKAWLNLLSRITSLITSFVSGYSTSVINVRDQARAIENKTNILKQFKTCYENGMFVPEDDDEMIEREYQEQEENKESELEKVDIEVDKV